MFKKATRGTVYRGGGAAAAGLQAALNIASTIGKQRETYLLTSALFSPGNVPTHN